MRIGSIAALALVGLSAAPARADVVWTEPCPWGARERTSHAGPRCTPWPCESDAQCEGGLVCRPWRVCTQTFEVPPAGRSAFRDPPPPPLREEQVVATCEPGGSCRGREEPRPPTSGRAIGAVQCRELRACVRPALPSLPNEAVQGGSTTTTTTTTTPPTTTPPTTTSPTTTSPTTTSPPTPSNTSNTSNTTPPAARGCACAVERVPAPPIGLALVLGLLVLRVMRARRRSR